MFACVCMCNKNPNLCYFSIERHFSTAGQIGLTEAILACLLQHTYYIFCKFIVLGKVKKGPLTMSLAYCVQLRGRKVKHALVLCHFHAEN